jgi:hypothetical protein
MPPHPRFALTPVGTTLTTRALVAKRKGSVAFFRAVAIDDDVALFGRTTA